MCVGEEPAFISHERTFVARLLTREAALHLEPTLATKVHSGKRQIAGLQGELEAGLVKGNGN